MRGRYEPKHSQTTREPRHPSGVQKIEDAQLLTNHSRRHHTPRPRSRQRPHQITRLPSSRTHRLKILPLRDLLILLTRHQRSRPIHLCAITERVNLFHERQPRTTTTPRLRSLRRHHNPTPTTNRTLMPRTAQRPQPTRNNTPRRNLSHNGLLTERLMSEPTERGPVPSLIRNRPSTPVSMGDNPSSSS